MFSVLLLYVQQKIFPFETATAITEIGAGVDMKKIELDKTSQLSILNVIIYNNKKHNLKHKHGDGIRRRNGQL